MKKKVVFVLLTLMSVFLLCTACSLTPKHTHSFGDWQSVDATYHSRSCSCGKSQKVEHNFAGDKCSVCGYEKSAGNNVGGNEGGNQGDNNPKQDDSDQTQSSEGLIFEKNGKGYSVTGIGTCKDTNIVIPSSYNNLPVISIGEKAFYDCNNITSITIPESVTTIGDYAFGYCSSITSITIPEDIINIGEAAFYGCYKLVEVYDLSKRLTITKGYDSDGYVGYYALGIYTNKETPSKIKEKDGYFFYEDTDKVYLFGYKGGDTKLTLPDYNGKNYEINQYAFYESDIASVTIPENVTSIGESAFDDCRNLKSVTFPSSVTSIGAGAFLGCDNLENVTFEKTEGWKWYESPNSTIGTEIPNLGDKKSAANKLRGILSGDPYIGYYWKRDAE